MVEKDIKIKFNKEFKKHRLERDEDEERGFELIKEWVELYPKTDYPNDLLEKFCRGARMMGINYLILPEDDDICPECKMPQGKVGNKALLLKTSFGMSTICNYCYVEMEQDEILNHNPSNCDHPKRNDENNEWCWEDCSAVAKAFEYSYKKILKEL